MKAGSSSVVVSLRYIVLALLVLLVALPLAQARGKRANTKLKIEPGPKVMSGEEKSLVADPENDIEHAIILVEETERDDTSLAGYRMKYHRRIKVLSNEARAVGDISLPIWKEYGTVHDFWRSSSVQTAASKSWARVHSKSRRMSRAASILPS